VRRILVLAALVAAFHLFAQHSTGFVAWASNWASILTFALLVVGGAIGGLSRINHGLHVSGERSELQVANTPAGQIGVAPGVEFTNTKPIPLRVQIERFSVRVNEADLPEIVPEMARHQDIAPGQDNRTWSRETVFVPAVFPMRMEVSYEFSYGRQLRWMWWMRRRLTGSTIVVFGRAPQLGQDLPVSARDLEDAPEDKWLVPLTGDWWRTRRRNP
jgi:hypothetical protein